MMPAKTLPKPTQPTIVRSATDGEVFRPPMGPQTVKVSKTETDGAFEMIEIDVVPNAGPPLHYHADFEEAFYVVDGTLSIQIGDRIVDLAPRASAIVPRGQVHTWKNRGDKLCRFIQITAPGSMEGMLAALAENPPKDLEEFARVCAPHGTIVVGPPM